jgi:hypothetical protein
MEQLQTEISKRESHHEKSGIDFTLLPDQEISAPDP